MIVVFVVLDAALVFLAIALTVLVSRTHRRACQIAARAMLVAEAAAEVQRAVDALDRAVWDRVQRELGKPTDDEAWATYSSFVRTIFALDSRPSDDRRERGSGTPGATTPLKAPTGVEPVEGSGRQATSTSRRESA